MNTLSVTQDIRRSVDFSDIQIYINSHGVTSNIDFKVTIFSYVKFI